MQLIANQHLVQNRMRLGTGFHLAAMGILILGIFVSTRPESAQDFLWASPVALIVGMLLFIVGQTQVRRWGPQQQQTEAIERAIKGLDDRYRLYAFLSSSLPNYILTGPGGVNVLEVRNEEGQVSCARDRWKKAGGFRLVSLFDQPLGNPSEDARRHAERVKTVLAGEGLEDIPVSGIVLLTNPKVQPRIEGCSVTVSRPRDLKEVLRRQAGKGQAVALNAARVREVQAVLDRRAKTARKWR